MKITVTITKDENENTYKAKFTSGVWQGNEKSGRNSTAEDIGQMLADLIKKADEKDLIGK